MKIWQPHVLWNISVVSCHQEREGPCGVFLRGLPFFFSFFFFFIQWMYGMFCFFSFLFPFCIIKYVFLSCRCLPERKTSIENDITKDLLSGNEWGGAPWYPRLLADNTLQKGEFGTFLWWYIYIFWWIWIIFTILFG